jgi:DNA repair protein RadC
MTTTAPTLPSTDGDAARARRTLSRAGPAACADEELLGLVLAERFNLIRLT